MSIKGTFSSTMARPGDRKVPGLAGALIHLDSTNQGPLLTMTGARTSKDLRSTSVQWTEKQNRQGIGFIVSNNGDPVGCILTLADTSWITENVIFNVAATGEFLFVKGISGNQITVERGFGNTPIVAIEPTATGHIMVMRVGTAFEEGSQRPAAVAHTGDIPKINYTQIFRNTWAITRTAKQIEYNLGDMKMRLKKDTLYDHVHDIEMAMLMGVRSNGTYNNQPFRSMDGLMRQIQTNIASPQDGIVTKSQLDFFFEVLFSQNIRGARTNSRICLCGRTWLTFITRLAEMNTHYILDPESTTYGMSINTFKTPHGVVHFVPHDMLTNNPIYSADAIFLHPESVYAYYMYEGEDDCSDGCSNGGIDGDIGSLTTEVTMALKGEITAGWITGVCDVAPDPLMVQLVEPHKPALAPAC